jgi:hypothetical protein
MLGVPFFEMPSPLLKIKPWTWLGPLFWLLRLRSYIVKLDEEMPTHAGLAHENVCLCICAEFVEAGKGRSKAVHLLEKSVIMWSVFLIGNHNYRSRWFAINSFPPICIACSHTKHRWRCWVCEEAMQISASPAVLSMWPCKNMFHIMYFFATSPIKLKSGQQMGGGLLIANHLDQSLCWANQKHSSHIYYRKCAQHNVVS